MHLISLGPVVSTNKHCEALDLAQVEDFTCFYTNVQTDGIGQRGNHWESQPDANLTFSLVLHPHFLHPSRQFCLTQMIALALYDCLTPLLPQHPVAIKWPNDIFAAGGKLCGTLITTHATPQRIASAICGIGLNVNQTAFSSWIPHPTSLALLTGNTQPLLPLLRTLLTHIEHRYCQLQQGIDLQPDYLAHLLNLGIAARYRYREAEIEATITGVDAHGRLLLTTADGHPLCCGMKEIALLSTPLASPKQP